MSTPPRLPQRHAPPTGPDQAGDGHGLLRIGLHLLLAALPLLAISAHVFGLVRMQVSAAILVIPLATALIALAVFAPHAGDRVLAHGLMWGIIACAIYDVFRLDTVYLLGWWDDFIPTMGTWITGDPDDLVGGAIVGYLWRYIGDGGGIGITFFALASAVGLHRRPRRTVVLVAIGFAVFPVWTGLIATVGLASSGQTMMFPLTPTTVTLSLIGHLIFGLILGLGFWRSRAVQEHWPWEPVTGEQRIVLPPGHPSGPFPSQPVAPATSRTARNRTRDRAGSGPIPIPRQLGPSTPPAGQSLDPETWELWQRQLQTTVRGRRTHGWQRSRSGGSGSSRRP